MAARSKSQSGGRARRGDLANDRLKLEAKNRELIAGQAASVEVLKAISASPGDTQPVFDLIARRAAELCDAVAVGVTEYDGTLMHMRSLKGYDEALSDSLMRSYPRPPGPETISGRVVLGGAAAHVRDVGIDAGLYQTAHELQVGTLLGMPLRDRKSVV